MPEEHPSSAWRLPVYLLLDCSGSITGDPLEAVTTGLRQLRAEL